MTRTSTQATPRREQPLANGSILILPSRPSSIFPGLARLKRGGRVFYHSSHRTQQYHTSSISRAQHLEPHTKIISQEFLYSMTVVAADNVLCIPRTAAVGGFVMVYKSGVSDLLCKGTLTVTPTQAISVRRPDAHNEILDCGHFLCFVLGQMPKSGIPDPFVPKSVTYSNQVKTPASSGVLSMKKVR